METAVFLVAAAACLAGAVGVVLSRNPVHAALSLVGTLFGIAVLFVAQEAHFLAAVQVIVYAGAIVVLFLFVIMLLGVDRSDDLREPIAGQRVAAIIIGVALFALPVLAFASVDFEATGSPHVDEVTTGVPPDQLEELGESLFTTYLFAFEITSLLLVIAVVGAVVLARRQPRSEEILDPDQLEQPADVDGEAVADEEVTS